MLEEKIGNVTKSPLCKVAFVNVKKGTSRTGRAYEAYSAKLEVLDDDTHITADFWVSMGFDKPTLKEGETGYVFYSMDGTYKRFKWFEAVEVKEEEAEEVFDCPFLQGLMDGKKYAEDLKSYQRKSVMSFALREG